MRVKLGFSKLILAVGIAVLTAACTFLLSVAVSVFTSFYVNREWVFVWRLDEILIPGLRIMFEVASAV